MFADDTQLFLSRLRLDPAQRAVWQCMSNSQRLHALLLRGFPDGDRRDHNMLFRADPVKGRRDRPVDIIVQSTMEPDWAYLRKEGLLLHDSVFFGDGLVKNISSLPSSFQNGDVYKFRLRANPTKRIPWNVWAAENPEKAREYERNARRYTSPRIPVTVLTGGDLLKPVDERPTAEEKLHEWLAKKGRANGFAVARVELLPDPLSGDMQRGEKRIPTGTMMLAHKAIVFEGLLKVADVALFREALIHGIGSGKAYGFGLLSLAPAGGA